MGSLIPILVPDRDAKSFLVFMEHHDLFDALQEAGVFELQWGKAILNFGKGQVQNIVVEEVAWKRNA